MKITKTLLKKSNVRSDQIELFNELFPLGLAPSPESFMEAASAGLDVLWYINLLPNEGPGSKRAFALWCAEQVAHLMPSASVAALDVVRRRVISPPDVSDRELDAGTHPMPQPGPHPGPQPGTLRSLCWQQWWMSYRKMSILQ